MYIYRYSNRCLYALLTLLITGLLAGGISVARAQGIEAENKNLSLNGINLSVRVLLQGPYQGESGLMSDALRTSGLLPTVQPYNIAPLNYGGDESLSAAVLALGDQDAAVDWLLLDLRADTAPFDVVARQAVILQRDGDVVGPDDGAVVLHFPDVPAGNYRVAIQHRNHLGIITAASLALGSGVTFVDFSHPQAQVAGNHARLIDGNSAFLWSGNTNQDLRLIARGVGNDSNAVLSSILQAPENTAFNSSYILEGYRASDLNMDGNTVYAGPGNDVNLLILNILSHPENTDFAGNFIIDPGVTF